MDRAAGNYDFEVDPENLNTTYGLIYRRVPEGAEVLDLGCASGNLALALEKRRGCRVLGVDLDRDAVAAASQKGVEAVIADVTRTPLAEVVAGRTFDRVVMADVLEHLADPGLLLSQVGSVLRPGGAVLVSFPNITHVDIQLMLAQGEWRYSPAGILDQTHLRFFTASSFSELALRHGFQVASVEEVTLPPLGTEVLLQGKALRLAQNAVGQVDGLSQGNPHSHTYQFVMELTRSDTERPLATPLAPKTARDSEPPELDFIVRTVPGREQLLREALYSLVSVEGARVRAIVVVHSDDPEQAERVRELAREYRDLLEAVEVIPVTGGLGCRGRPLNAGLAASRAEFLAFLDDDDVVYPTFAQRLVGRLREDRSLTVAYGHSQVVYGQLVDGRFQALHQGHQYAHPFDRAALFSDNYIPINALVIRAQAIREAGLQFDANLQIFEDWLFLCSLAARYQFAEVPQLVSEYRMREDGSNATAAIDERAGFVAREAIAAATAGMRVTVSGAELARLSIAYKEREAYFREESGRLQDQVASLQRTVRAVLGSRSWAVTRPLRRVMGSRLPDGESGP